MDNGSNTGDNHAIYQVQGIHSIDILKVFFSENSLVISVALLFLGKGTFDSEIERYD